MKKLVLSILIVCIFTVDVSATEKRIALVIGNANYPEVGQLLNPLNDARLIASTLTYLGFEVAQKTDVSLKDMKKAIRAFGGKLDEAGKEGVGLFYYAGHGLQVDGSNYIIPVDAAIERRGDVDIEAIDMASILSMMEYSRSRLNFVILDACRNNPYSRGFRSATRGLAQMDSPTGSLIAYSTSPGSLAADGEDLNSPYTKALASAMRLENVEVEKMFRIVRNDVRKLTGDLQTPWESSSLTGDSFYFNQADSTDSVKQEIPTTPTEEARVTTNLELEFWNAVADSSDPMEIQSYIDNYPNGHFVDLAMIRLKKLQKEEPLVISKVDDTRKVKNESDLPDNSIEQISNHSFDGLWKVYMSELSGCLNNNPRTFEVNVFKSTINESGHNMPKTGSVSQNGEFTIKITDGYGNFRGTHKGTLRRNHGEGILQGKKLNCVGKVSLIKQN